MTRRFPFGLAPQQTGHSVARGRETSYHSPAGHCCTDRGRRTPAPEDSNGHHCHHSLVLTGLSVVAANIALIGADDAIAQGEALWCCTDNTLRHLARLGLGNTEA